MGDAPNHSDEHADGAASDEDWHPDAEHEHAEEGEPWLISYADMMTLLFAFFVLMYSFAARDEKRMECLNLKVAETFGLKNDADPSETKAFAADTAAMRALQMLVATMHMESLDELAKKMQDRGKDARAAEELAAELQKDSTIAALKALLELDKKKKIVSIVIPTEALFASGSDNALPASVARLAEIGHQIAALGDVSEIEVVGYADSRGNESAGARNNWNLSLLRAASVGRTLMASGVHPSLVKVAGRGDAAPLFPEKDAKGAWIEGNLAKNRRVEIRIQRTQVDAT